MTSARKRVRRTRIAIGVACVAAAMLAPTAGAVSGSNTITTIAGTGTGGFTGDGLPSTSSQVNNPSGLAVSDDGKVYIADSGNHRIRVIGTDGFINTIAGSSFGFAGDGGPASAAQLYFPRGLSLDASGGLYFADASNHRIRYIDSSGNISSVAGTGGGGSTADGPAGSVSLSGPWGVAVDANDTVHFTDSGRQRIRYLVNGLAATEAGTGTAGYTGEGQATSNRVYTPSGIATDSNGVIYFADYSNRRIRKIEGGILSTIAGDGTNGYTGDGGPATSARVNNPRDLALDKAGNIYIADQSNHAIRKIATDGTISTVVGGNGAGGSGDGGAASAAQLNTPYAVAVGPDGSLYIATGGDKVQKVANSQPSVVLSSNKATGEAPLEVAFDGSGSTDTDGSILTHNWSFGDGGTSTATSPTHTYSSGGTYTVTLTVMDDSGAQVSTTTQITVTDGEAGGSGSTPDPGSPTTPTDSTPGGTSPSTITYRCQGRTATIVGTTGNDKIVGTSGNDVIVALSGNDVVSSGSGNDRICLGSGNDRASGGAGRDVIIGGTGQDIIRGGTGRDIIFGGRGRDRLFGQAGRDTLRGGSQADTQNGGAGNDVLRGEAGNDILYGGAGKDRLYGGRHNDLLFGGKSNDRLFGNGGRDTGSGGAGKDACRTEVRIRC